MGKASRMKAARKASGCNQDSQKAVRCGNRHNGKRTAAGPGGASVGLPAEAVAFLNQLRSDCDKLKAMHWKKLMLVALSQDDVVAFERAVNKGAEIPMDIGDVSVSYKGEDGEVVEVSILEVAFYSQAINCFKWLCVMNPNHGVGYEISVKFAHKLYDEGMLFSRSVLPELQECVKHVLREMLVNAHPHGALANARLGELKGVSPLADAVVQEFIAEKTAREEQAALLAATPAANSPATEKLAVNHEDWVEAGHEIPLPPLPVAASTNSVRL